jgi:uncharacterized membrane protein
MSERRAIGLVVLALVGAAISMELAAFQLGLVAGVWDPIFGDGSRAVLTSPLSQALPVPDALIGAVVYLIDAALGIALVLRVGAGAIVAAVLAAVSSMGAVVGIGLAISQPLIAHAFCTLCLASTVVSIALAIGAIGEARDRWPTGMLDSDADEADSRRDSATH